MFKGKKNMNKEEIKKRKKMMNEKSKQERNKIEMKRKRNICHFTPILKSGIKYKDNYIIIVKDIVSENEEKISIPLKYIAYIPHLKNIIETSSQNNDQNNVLVDINIDVDIFKRIIIKYVKHCSEQKFETLTGVEDESRNGGYMTRCMDSEWNLDNHIFNMYMNEEIYRKNYIDEYGIIVGSSDIKHIDKLPDKYKIFIVLKIIKINRILRTAECLDMKNLMKKMCIIYTFHVWGLPDLLLREILHVVRCFDIMIYNHNDVSYSQEYEEKHKKILEYEKNIKIDNTHKCPCKKCGWPYEDLNYYDSKSNKNINRRDIYEIKKYPCVYDEINNVKEKYNKFSDSVEYNKMINSDIFKNIIKIFKEQLKSDL